MVIQVEYRMGNKSYPAVMWDAIFFAIFLFAGGNSGKQIPEGGINNVCN